MLHRSPQDGPDNERIKMLSDSTRKEMEEGTIEWLEMPENLVIPFHSPKSPSDLPIPSKRVGTRVSYQPLSAHPDTTLRRTGIIQQSATLGLFGKKIHYDPNQSAWVHTKDSVPLPANFNPRSGSNQRDTVPEGIVYVVGSMQFADFVDTSHEGNPEGLKRQFDQLHALFKYRHGQEASAVNSHGKDPQQNQEKKASHTVAAPTSAEKPMHRTKEETMVWMRKEAALMRCSLLQTECTNMPSDKQLHSEASESFVDIETDSKFVTPMENLKHIRQYLMRSVIHAAIRTRSIIFTSATGDLAEALGEGSHLNNPVEEQSPQVRVVKVAGMAKEPLDAKYTDHIVYFENRKYNLQDADPKIYAPTRAQVDAQCRRLIQQLSDGYNVISQVAMDKTRSWFKEPFLSFLNMDLTMERILSLNLKEEAPARKACPVVVTLFGGDMFTAKYELALAVERLWPIFIFDGSGGYADALVRCIQLSKKYETSYDRHKAFLSTLDPITAEIVKSGHCIVIRKVEVVENVKQAIESALFGDDTLRLAWARYALWYANMERFNSQYYSSLIQVLVLGILATSLSIWQTYAQLQSRDSYGDQLSFTTINVIVIFLPILMQLRQTITNRMNPGAKWVSLRWASERVAREIYMYRTRACEYSNEAVLAAKKRRENSVERKNQKKINLQEALEAHRYANSDIAAGTAIGEDEDDEDQNMDEVYESRQELLHLRVEKLTLELADTDFSDTTLEKYEGMLPPIHIQVTGDEGFKDLTPDEYVTFRLRQKEKDYLIRSAHAHYGRKILVRCVHVFNTLGTIVAALATYRATQSYNLYSWVSLTTALVGALTRFEHLMMLDWLQRKYNCCYFELSNVIAWWSSRGTSRGKASFRDELVREGEGIIQSEVAEFRKQIKTSLVAASTFADELNKMKQDALAANGAEISQQEAFALQKVKELATGDALSIASMQALLTNPASATAKKALQSLQKLNKDLGDVITQAETKAARQAELLKNEIQLAYRHHVTDIKEVLDQMEDPTGILQHHLKPNEIKNFFPKSVVELIADAKYTGKFMESLQEATQADDHINITRKLILTHCPTTSNRHLEEQMKSMPYYMCLHVFRSVIQSDLMRKVNDALQSTGLSEHDFIENPDDGPLLFAELASLAALPWRYTPQSLLVCFVTNDLLRFKMGSLAERKFRAVLKRAEKILLQDNAITHAFTAVNQSLADIDIVNMLLDSDVNRIKVIANVLRNKRSEFPTMYYSREEITEYFPPELHPWLQQTDDGLLKHYIERLQEAMPTSHMINQWLTHPLTSKYTNLRKALYSAEDCESFLLATKSFSQIDILRMGKQTLLCRLNNCPHVDDKMLHGLKMCTEEELRHILCHLQTTHMNSYAGRIFDLLTDEMTSFDIYKMLDFEEQLLLVKRMDAFREVNVMTLTPKEILSTIAYRRIANKLNLLDAHQIRELVTRIIHLLSSTLNVFMFRNAVCKSARKNKKYVRYLSVVRTWKMESMDRMTRSIVRIKEESHLSESETDLMEDDRLLRCLDDSESKQILQRARLPVDFMKSLFKDIQNNFGDPLTTSLFEGMSRNIRIREDLFVPFVRFFALAEHRELMLKCLTNLLKASPECFHIDKCRAMTAAELKKKMIMTGAGHGDEMMSKFAEALYELCKKEEKDFTDLVSSVLADSIVNIAYLIALRVADEIESFALRGVVCTVRTRVLLTLLINKLINGKNKKVTFQPDGKCSGKRTDFFQNYDTLQKYSAALNEISVLPEDMLGSLMEKFNLIINKTTGGEFFKAVHAVTKKSNEFVKSNDFAKVFKGSGRWMFYAAIITLRSQTKDTAAASHVLANMNGFDSQVFARRLESDRKKALSLCLSSDDISWFLSKLKEKDYALIFSFLKSIPSGINMHEKMAFVGEQMRLESFWSVIPKQDDSINHEAERSRSSVMFPP